ncbi:hypothetical protein SEUCBS139899_008354 [Sporothrix eucalyptigena]
MPEESMEEGPEAVKDGLSSQSGQDNPVGVGLPGRITFGPDRREGRTDEEMGVALGPVGGTSRATSRARRRSVSRSSRQRSRSRSRTAGIPIEYRTLSIHVSESRRKTEDDLENLKNRKGGKDSKAGTKGGAATLEVQGDYFASLDFHELEVAELCQRFNVDAETGLSEHAAATRLARDGPNTLPAPRTNYALKLFWYVFGGFCSVLWVGVVIFFLCWQPLSSPPSVPNLALAILVIIVILLQAGFSGFQDWSTQRTMRAILGLLPSDAFVRRDGAVHKRPTAALVAGDVVQLQTGNRVPADLRLVAHTGDLRFDRSLLTGEVEAIAGTVTCTDANVLESRNMALMGTMVVGGSGVGVVVLTGASSVMGRIATATAAAPARVPLIQREISRFVRIIVGLTVVLALVILITWIAWLRVDHHNFMNVVAMLNDVMGCVVAFIPEGMPVGVALTLLLVANRMKNANILPKGLTTVETLGCVDVLCSDKTGTLTENRMAVTSAAFVDRPLSDNERRVMVDGNADGGLRRLREAALLCNDAAFEPSTMMLPMADRLVQGNATDAAVLRMVADGTGSEAVAARCPRLFTVAFNSTNKWMLTMHTADGDKDNDAARPTYRVLVKGAPDVLLPACTHYWSGNAGAVRPLDADARAAFQACQDGMSRNAERVIVLCERTMVPKNALGTDEFDDEVSEHAVADLTVLGILGITDPPRPETAHTVAACRRAGMRFFMVTGDYSLTAAAIARRVGIFTGDRMPDDAACVRPGENAGAANGLGGPDGPGGPDIPRQLLLTGHDVGQLDEAGWDSVCAYDEIVFARTTPEHKLRIVEALRARHHVVAVTGDGVNDAPALRAADVGVAVASGSDVAMEAADLVLLDRFDAVLDAVRYGRLVFQNLQKVIAYLLPAGSCSEIWPVLLNVFFGVPLPLSSFLMIIICVFTDLFLSLSLIMEQEEFDLMARSPRNHRRDHLITLRIYIQAYLLTGTLETLAAHSMFFLYMWRHAGIPVRDLFFLYEGYTDGFHGYTTDELTHFNVTGQCVYFVTLVLLQWGNILAVRNRRVSMVHADPITNSRRRNPWLLLSMAISLAIAVFVTQEPGIQRLFGTASVPIEFWFIPIPLAIGILLVDELRKLLVRLYPKGPLARIAW